MGSSSTGGTRSATIPVYGRAREKRMGIFLILAVLVLVLVPVSVLVLACPCFIRPRVLVRAGILARFHLPHVPVPRPIRREPRFPQRGGDHAVFLAGALPPERHPPRPLCPGRECFRDGLGGPRPAGLVLGEGGHDLAFPAGDIGGQLP